MIEKKMMQKNKDRERIDEMLNCGDTSMNPVCMKNKRH